jgi:hypothetical protein
MTGAGCVEDAGKKKWPVLKRIRVYDAQPDKIVAVMSRSEPVPVSAAQTSEISSLASSCESPLCLLTEMTDRGSSFGQVEPDSNRKWMDDETDTAQNRK